MYTYDENSVKINDCTYGFEFNIRAVLQHEGKYIILLEIPFNNKTNINNIYCLDERAKLVWRSEDLSVRFPELKNPLPYEQMGIKDGRIFASDFYGRNYRINISSGKVEQIKIVK